MPGCAHARAAETATTPRPNNPVRTCGKRLHTGRSTHVLASWPDRGTSSPSWAGLPARRRRARRTARRAPPVRPSRHRRRRTAGDEGAPANPRAPSAAAFDGSASSATWTPKLRAISAVRSVQPLQTTITSNSPGRAPGLQRLEQPRNRRLFVVRRDDNAGHSCRTLF